MKFISSFTLLKFLTLLFVFSTTITTILLGQTTHSVTLTWQDNLNPTGTAYNLYRSPGLCSGTPVFAKIINNIATKTVIDNTVTPGNYCYAVTAIYNGVESSQSNSTLAPVPSFAPTNLSVTVQ